MTAHRLVLVDRGSEHRHRWGIGCSCSWSGVPRRRKREAIRQHHAHREQAARRLAQLAMVPGEVTPADRVPDVLR